jgi:hypothetical protein
MLSTTPLPMGFPGRRCCFLQRASDAAAVIRNDTEVYDVDGRGAEKCKQHRPIGVDDGARRGLDRGLDEFVAGRQNTDPKPPLHRNARISRCSQNGQMSGI